MYINGLHGLPFKFVNLQISDKLISPLFHLKCNFKLLKSLGQQIIELPCSRLSLTLIGRRSIEYAGTRYLKRGANSRGYFFMYSCSKYR